MRAAFALICLSISSIGFAEGTSLRLDVGSGSSDLFGRGNSHTELAGIAIGQTFLGGLGGEIGYSRFADFERGYTESNVSYRDRLELSVWEAGAFYRHEFNQAAPGFYLEARLGVAFTDLEGVASRVATMRPVAADNGLRTATLDDNDNNVYFGLGAGYRIAPQLDLGLDFTRYKIQSITTSISRSRGNLIITPEDEHVRAVTLKLTWNF